MPVNEVGFLYIISKFLVQWGIGTVVFVLLPISYFLIIRPLDKMFEMKNTILERGYIYGSVVARLAVYTLGILLQPYRGRDDVPKLLRRVTWSHMARQDHIYEKVVDLRAPMTRFRIGLVALIFILMAIGFIGAWIGAFDRFILGNPWP